MNPNLSPLLREQRTTGMGYIIQIPQHSAGTWSTEATAGIILLLLLLYYSLFRPFSVFILYLRILKSRNKKQLPQEFKERSI